MKKIITGIAVILLMVLVFTKCNNKSIEKIEPNFTEEVQKIEKNINEKSIDIPKYITPYDLNNQSFFKNLSEIFLKKKSERFSKNDLDNLINNTLKRYRNNLIISNENLKSEKKLTPNEELIFKSYFKELNNSNLSKIKITNYYISQIVKLNLSKKSLQITLNTLSFIRQLMVSINYDKSVNLHQTIEDYDGCVDACMRAKADAVFFYGNWVDQAEFIFSAAETTAWWIGSCMWHCA